MIREAMLKAGILSDGKVWVRAITGADDFEYLMGLIPKYKYHLAETDSRNVTLKYAKHMWVAFADVGQEPKRIGVIYLQYFPESDRWTLDAYRDHLSDSEDFRGDFSFRIGKLIVDWFCAHYPGLDLWTTHDHRNVAATKVCKRLNFRETEIVKIEIGEFIVLRRGV